MNALENLGWEIKKGGEFCDYYLSRHKVGGTDYVGVNIERKFISVDGDLSIDDMEAIVKFIKEMENTK